MDSLEQLLQKYADDKRGGKAIAASISERPTNFRFSGLVGAQESFVLAGTYLAAPFRALYIAESKEAAAYLYHNLTNLLPGKPIWYFPDSYRRPGVYERLNNNQVLQRTESINKVTSDPDLAHVVVTYPEALVEQVVSPKVLSENRISLKIGEEVDVDFLIEILIEYGFDHVDFVYEPGQFSMRGGIFDLFSFGNEWPYRVELFDEEIESIRTFNPISQLSLKNISSVAIVPNINRKFDVNEKMSLLKLLREDFVLFMGSDQFLLDRFQACFETAQALPGRPTEDEPADTPDLVTPSQVMQDLQSFSKVFVRDEPSHFDVLETTSFEATPQPSFNKNFALLIDDLERLQKDGYTNYLFTDNPRQVKRFETIFSDLEAKVQFVPVLKSIDKGFIDHMHKIACYTDHQIFQRFHKYTMRRGFSKDQALSLKFLRELQPGDYVTHIDHGVGRYSGLEKININGHEQESVRLIYKNNDVLYVSIQSLHKISKYAGKDGVVPTLNKLGSDAWSNLKRRTKRKVKDIAGELIKLYAKRKATPGHKYPPDSYLQDELEASFFYEDTPDQLAATQEVKADMEKPHPMDRLICGDVGFGKTEIAIRAAFKAVADGKQVAVLVPTTILALQHHKTFQERLGSYGINIDFLNRFKSSAQKKEIYEQIKLGNVEIIIGTHALLNKRVSFKDLGLLIIDEEQKFGVAAKEKLRSLQVNVDTLTLTATPIPRTLQFSLMAARDLSIIRTAPPNRQPIHTETRVFNDKLIKESIYYEVNRGGQVFFVHNRVKNLAEMKVLLRRLCPDVEIEMAHGQMESKDLEKTLVGFIEHQFDVLLCTNIIETGLDIPNANTIIINNAHQFGMSDLHQLRGRVGRSNRKAFCYLFSPPMSTLTSEARKRLRTLEEFSDLGSGFNIAMRDLDIRGAGNLLGGEQSGFITEIGFETYTKILEEAIQELKETDFKDLFEEDIEERVYVRDVQFETDQEMLIPDAYINNIQERLNLYTELDHVKDEDGLKVFEQKLADRFGPVPKRVYALFDALRLRWICRRAGFERCVLKNSKLTCFFVLNAQSPFYETQWFQRFLEYISTNGADLKVRLKQSRNYLLLIKEGVSSTRSAFELLHELVDAVEQQAESDDD